MKRKLLIFLIDGIGDVAVPELGFKTPLQVAHTPWMDKLAGKQKLCKLRVYDILIRRRIRLERFIRSRRTRASLWIRRCAHVNPRL